MVFAPLMGFESKKAAQLAAYLLTKQRDMTKLKLIKLMYICERNSVASRGHPMLYDEMYSLEHGPICSNSLNAINEKPRLPEWAALFRIRADGRKFDIIKSVARDDLDELSDAEIEIADEVWHKLGKLSASNIRAWAHKNCAEYTEVDRGRVPITYGQMATAVGEDAGRVESDVWIERRVASILGG